MDIFDDLKSIIVLYLNYYDLSNLYQVDSSWNIFLKKTNYFRFLELINNCNIKFKETKRLFYHFCHIGEIEIARNIYLIGNFRIFLIQDMFHLNICPVDLETVKRVVRIKGFYDDFIFLRKEIFDKYIVYLKTINIFTKDKCELHVLNLCQKKRNTSMAFAKFQLFYVFGDMEETNLNLIFVFCCSNGKSDFIDFLCKYNKFNYSTIQSGIISSITHENTQILLRLVGLLNNDRKIIENVINVCCNNNKMNMVREIQKSIV